jgi:hypothetical protein
MGTYHSSWQFRDMAKVQNDRASETFARSIGGAYHKGSRYEENPVINKDLCRRCISTIARIAEGSSCPLGGILEQPAELGRLCVDAVALERASMCGLSHAC